MTIDDFDVQIQCEEVYHAVDNVVYYDPEFEIQRVDDTQYVIRWLNGRDMKVDGELHDAIFIGESFTFWD